MKVDVWLYYRVKVKIPLEIDEPRIPHNGELTDQALAEYNRMLTTDPPELYMAPEPLEYHQVTGIRWETENGRFGGTA